MGDHYFTNHTDGNDGAGNASVTDPEYALQNFDITTKDVLKTTSGMKTNKRVGPGNKFLKKQNP